MINLPFVCFKELKKLKWSNEIDTVSLKNPDGTIISVVLNATDEKKDFIFRIKGKVVETNITPHSIATYIFTP